MTLISLEELSVNDITFCVVFPKQRYNFREWVNDLVSTALLTVLLKNEIRVGEGLKVSKNTSRHLLITL